MNEEMDEGQMRRMRDYERLTKLEIFMGNTMEYIRQNANRLERLEKFQGEIENIINQLRGMKTILIWMCGITGTVLFCLFQFWAKPTIENYVETEEDFKRNVRALLRKYEVGDIGSNVVPNTRK